MIRYATFSDKKDNVRTSYRLMTTKVGLFRIERAMYLRQDYNSVTCWNRSSGLVQRVHDFLHEEEALVRWRFLLRQESNRLRRLDR